MVKVSRDSQMLESELHREKDQKVWCLPQPTWAAGVGGVGSNAAISYVGVKCHFCVGYVGSKVQATF